MAIIGQILYSLAGIGILVCFILVLVQMFKRGQLGIGIACIVLAFCGIGFLVAFILGWIRHREWGLTKVMLVWTVCIILSIVGSVLSPINTAAFVPQLP